MSEQPLPSFDLDYHGDAELAPGLLDCATTIRLPGPPAWLRARLADALADLGRYRTPRPHARPSPAATGASPKRCS